MTFTNTDNMLLSDYLSTFQESHFHKYILAYLRLKETDQFIEQIDISRNSCSLLSDQNISINEYENYEKISISEDISNVLWNNVVATLNYCKDNNRTRELLSNYNKILRLHVDHNIHLDSGALTILPNCTQPRVIEDLFNAGLVRPKSIYHLEFLLGNLFKEMDIFISQLETINPLVNAMTILIYKARCSENGFIMSSLYRLAALVNRCENDFNDKSLASDEWKKFKSFGVKRLLKAAYLNGVFRKYSLNRLLNFKSREYESDDESENEWDWYLVADIDENNNRIERRRISFGDRIASPANSQEISGMFVMTLKNLARIRIKNSIPEYGKKNVNRLGMLPRELRNFLLFKDEIDSVLRV